MQLGGHVRRSAPLRGQVRRRRAPRGASLGAEARPTVRVPTRQTQFRPLVDVPHDLAAGIVLDDEVDKSKRNGRVRSTGFWNF